MVEATGPLRGLRIIDLTRMLAGPYCTMLLADMGADVIKVEPPEGDSTRAHGPFRADDVKRFYGGYFQSVNRNKRSVVLDLSSEPDRTRLLELVSTADVLVENFRPGVMERWNLQYERLATENPRLIYAAIRGFGDPRTGETQFSNWPAYDIVAQAMGGLIGITGAPGAPVKAGPGVGDIFPAALCALGIMSAVYERGRSGLGQFLDVALYDAIIALCERIIFQYSYTGTIATPQGNRHPLLCPFDVFGCRDGQVAIAAPNDHQWDQLARAIGRPDLAEVYFSNDARLANAANVRKAISAWTETRTREEIMASLGGTVPVGPVNTVEDIVRDPHVTARNMLSHLEQPGSGSPVMVVAPPIKFLRTPASVRDRAPLLDEHRDEILDPSSHPAAERYIPTDALDA